MNKIVREHYPASRLPEDLKVGLSEGAMVRVVIEESSALDERRVIAFDGPFGYKPPEGFIPLEETLKSIRDYKARHKPSTTDEEAVRRIRELRDEWDDE